MRIVFTSSRLRCRRSTAANTLSPAIGSVVIFDTMGRTAFTTLRSTGKIRSMYQFMISGRLSSRRVSAVGAQSTTSMS